MNSVQISLDGQTATIGGGAKAKEVIDALWAAGKQSGKSMTKRLSEISPSLLEIVTGVCECTGIVGPMLGGGHGFLQGYVCSFLEQLVPFF